MPKNTKIGEKRRQYRNKQKRKRRGQERKFKNNKELNDTRKTNSRNRGKLAKKKQNIQKSFTPSKQLKKKKIDNEAEEDEKKGITIETLIDNFLSYNKCDIENF